MILIAIIAAIVVSSNNEAKMTDIEAVSPDSGDEEERHLSVDNTAEAMITDTSADDQPDQDVVQHEDVDTEWQTSFAFVNKLAQSVNALAANQKLSELFAAYSEKLRSYPVTLMRHKRHQLLSGVGVGVTIKADGIGVLDVPCIGYPYKVDNDVRMLVYEQSGRRARFSSWSGVAWDTRHGWVVTTPVPVDDPDDTGLLTSLNAAYAGVLDEFNKDFALTTACNA